MYDNISVSSRQQITKPLQYSSYYDWVPFQTLLSFFHIACYVAVLHVLNHFDIVSVGTDEINDTNWGSDSQY